MTCDQPVPAAESTPACIWSPCRWRTGGRLMVAVVPVSALEQNVLGNVNRSESTTATLIDDSGTFIASPIAGTVGKNISDFDHPRMRDVARRHYARPLRRHRSFPGRRKVRRHHLQARAFDRQNGEVLVSDLADCRHLDAARCRWLRWSDLSRCDDLGHVRHARDDRPSRSRPLSSSSAAACGSNACSATCSPKKWPMHGKFN